VCIFLSPRKKLDLNIDKKKLMKGSPQGGGHSGKKRYHKRGQMLSKTP